MDQPDFGGDGFNDGLFDDAEEITIQPNAAPAAQAAAYTTPQAATLQHLHHHAPATLIQHAAVSQPMQQQQQQQQTDIFSIHAHTELKQEDPAGAQAKGKRKPKEPADPNKPKRQKKEPGTAPKRQKKGSEPAVTGAMQMPGAAGQFSAPGMPGGTTQAAAGAAGAAASAPVGGAAAAAAADSSKPAARAAAPRVPRAKATDPLLSKAGLQQVLQNLGLEGDYKLDERLEAALVGLTDEFVKQVLEVGVDMHKRRKGSISLLPSDMKEYLQRAWQVAVPGPGSNPHMVPYKRAAGSTVHATRLANIKEALEKGQGGAAGGGGQGRQ